MITIIAGSRDITDLRLLEKVIVDSKIKITEVVCGGARGVDDLGRKWSGNGNRIPLKLFPADWNRFGKSAGYKRNVEMANYANALIALWDGTSRGTKHMINIATQKGLIVYVRNLLTNPNTD